MRSREVLKLVAGFRRFREKYFSSDEWIYKKFASGQHPKTLIIACSDSRVDPALISGASPGELFVVRNVANLVPPFESSPKGRHGVSAAIEFAVVNLKVENIIIFGHRQCGGIRALMTDDPKLKDQKSFVTMWMSALASAREKVLTKFKDLDFDSQCKECELEGIVCSIQNLKSFPFVKEALDSKQLDIIGIFFDLEQGTLLEYNEDDGNFFELKIDKSHIQR